MSAQPSPERVVRCLELKHRCGQPLQPGLEQETTMSAHTFFTRSLPAGGTLPIPFYTEGC